MELEKFLAIQPWFLPISGSTYHNLTSSLQFYTILCDSCCHLLYKNQYCEISIPPKDSQLPSVQSLPFSTHQTHSTVNNSTTTPMLNEKEPIYDIPIELIIAISTSSTSRSHQKQQHQPQQQQQQHFPCLFLKINHQFYFTDHTTIQELTFPKPNPSNDNLYLLIKWSTISFYIYISPDYSSCKKIIYDKLFSAITCMNKILKCSFSTACNVEIKKWYEEQFTQQLQFNQNNYQNKMKHNLLHSENVQEVSKDNSSTTVGALMASSSSISQFSEEQVLAQGESPNLKESIDSLMDNSSHLFVLDSIESSLFHWIDSFTISQHLLQPILPSQLYHELLLSSSLPYPISAPSSSSSSSSSSHQTKKRSRSPDPPLHPPLNPSPSLISSSHSAPPAPPLPPLPPPQEQQQQIPSMPSFHSQFNKKSKNYPFSPHDLPSQCLLNLPYDITVHSASPPPPLPPPSSSSLSSCHPYLSSCLESLSSSFLSIEESDYFEKSLYHSLETMEKRIFKSYSNHLANSRLAPAPPPPGPSLPQPPPPPQQQCQAIQSAAQGGDYWRELEGLLTVPYKSLIEDISTLRILPRNDHTPLHPGSLLSSPVSSSSSSSSSSSMESNR